jgi:hypothetical protein
MSRRLVSSIGRRFPRNRRIIMWCRISGTLMVLPSQLARASEPAGPIE